MNVIGVILGGGAGTRLQPLTTERSKPAVPIAGKYRLVDIPISNCINNDIKRIYVLTQFNSESLHRHIQTTYRFDSFSHSFVRILAAQQTPDGDKWYTGTADAVRKTLVHYADESPDYVVILSGDQLYAMDFNTMLEDHVSRGAEVTIATKPTDRRDAGSLGILQVDENGRIINFVEKPGDTPELTKLRAPMYEEERYLASMGIYIFNTETLKRLLDSDDQDFGKEVIPQAIHDTKVYSHIYEGYWRDIGTIRNFWESSLQLTDDMPEFNLYDLHHRIYTRMRFLPPSKVLGCVVNHCLLTEGCILSGREVTRSIVGIRGVIGQGTVMRNTVMMGADYYENGRRDVKSDVPLGIGRDCYIEDAIIDKNARIGDRVVISPKEKKDGVYDNYTVSDGVIVVAKGAVIPPDTVL
ncbi:MAG: glucose-1-phosphate adenylyltransferase [Verrucomicrobia bacterium]|nr:glucose-1-phosphate adenylyltransferase [Verrucomicrobiota bacterium]MCH8511078.1 glucose-1-phosphate adenylyltransferase [Kiritimatiellia bacterium]